MQRRDRLRPALMQCVAARGDNGLASADPAGAAHGAGAAAAAADKAQGSEQVPQLQVVLWRADALVSMLELDAGMVVARADATSGLLLGLGPKALLKKDFRK